MFLLDTNTCIEYLRNRNAHVLRRVNTTPAADIRLCSVVVAELYYGACRSQRPAANLALLTRFLSLFHSLPFDDPAAERFGQIRSHLERTGQPIGPYDNQIAAIALLHRLVVVTRNTAEFSRVPGLVLEDWTAP